MTAILIRNALTISLKGKGSQGRKLAYLDIAPTAYSEGVSRVAVIAAVKLALGKTPTDSDRAVARAEYVIGRAAARMPATELPKGTTDASAKLIAVRELVELYAAPPKDGVASRKLRKGQKGRRSVAQHKVIRAAEEAWSQVLADCGIGAAQTQGERNTKKRAPQMAGSTGRGKKDSAPTHSELVAGPKPIATQSDFMAHVALQSAALLAFCNKNAKHSMTDTALAIKALHKVAMTDKALAESIAA